MKKDISDLVGLFDNHYGYYVEFLEAYGETDRRTQAQLAFYRGLLTAAYAVGYTVVERDEHGKHKIIGG